jgi:hypothetical protein
MFPNEETSLSHNLTVDDASATLRVTTDKAFLGYAKLYRDMAELRD